MTTRDRLTVKESTHTLLPDWKLLARLSESRRHDLARLLDSAALILGRVASSGLGFLTWLITARLFEAREVGIASGVVSAMMLCVQLALFGVGAAVIVLYPRYLTQPGRVINSAINLVALFSVVTGALFLLLASAFFRELNIVSASPAYAMLFLGITLFGAVNVLMDHVSIALRRSDQVFIRNVAFGIVTILAVSGLALLGGGQQSPAIVLSWALAGLLACTLGAVQIARSVPGYRYVPVVEGGISRDLVQAGLPNYLLTLAERAPNWILPILVTELLSPADNAHWYSVWMMAWVVFLVPISIGQNLFADIARHPLDGQRAIGRSLRTSLLVGGAAALGAMLVAPLMLSLLGSGYAQAGAAPLRILALAVFPVTLVQVYYAICRGQRRLREATLTGLAAGIVGIGAAVAAGVNAGITGMAAAWLVTQSLAGLWAGVRIWMIVREGQKQAAS